MADRPSFIVDIHTHLFNAYCLPMAGIIANAMNMDAGESRFARALAALINVIGDGQKGELGVFSTVLDPEEHYIEQLTQITLQAMNEPSQLMRYSDTAVSFANDSTGVKAAINRIFSSDVYQCIKEIEETLIEDGELISEQIQLQSLGDITRWARRVLEKAWRTFLKKIVEPTGEIKNYLEFIFRMLTSEEDLAAALQEQYKLPVGSIQFVHHMMDMQYAYVTETTPPEMVAPKYPFYPVQIERMRAVNRKYSPNILGFCAFDPRHEKWREIAEFAISKGFIGFKFYPAMGYLPTGSPEPLDGRIKEFFRFCIKGQYPVFAHCTPEGFETRQKYGLNADPRNWESLLKTEGFEELRLCLAHGGGGKSEHIRKVGGPSTDVLRSPGWVAPDKGAWESTDNFAFHVARLCRTFPNVYCDLAYITELIEGLPDERECASEFLHENIKRAMSPIDSSEKYNFMEKVCYGSDWNMPSMVGHPSKYLEAMTNIFDGRYPDISKYRDNFFWKNAYRFLKIT